MKRGRPDVERILTAFNLEEPDRVPFFELSVADSIKEAVIGRPPLTIHDEMEFSVKIGFDVVKTSLYWVPGVERQASSSGREYVVGGRVRCREDLERLRLTIPDPDDPALYEEVERAVKAVEGSGLGVFTAINACWEIRHCMDMPFFLASIYRNPGLVEKMLDMYAGFYAKVVRNLSQIGVDFIFVTEDIAYRSGPFVSPETLRRLVFSRYRRILDGTDLPVAFHSDGNILPVIDDLISLGFCAIHPIEPTAMDIVEVKRRYGDKVCLIGNIDLCYTLTRGSPREVREEVRTRISQVAPGGGYMVSSANTIPDYVPLENFLAMADAVKRYGEYPHGGRP